MNSSPQSGPFRAAAILFGVLLVSSCVVLTTGNDDQPPLQTAETKPAARTAQVPAVQTTPAQRAVSLGTELPRDVQSALAPLFAASTPYVPATYRENDLPPDLDPLLAVALGRLNSYRIAAGLVPYHYDPELRKMAEAHVRFAAASSRANLPWQGHFETYGQPGYSREGNEAASTSGIAYGNSDALSALEGLMEGTYHRLQFLRPNETRVGVGFGKWESNSICLFVTRPGKGGQAKTAGSAAPRFVLFPPPDSSGIGTTFGWGENPDPRPGYDALAPGQRVPTGFPITISLSQEDTTTFQRAEVRVLDMNGSPVDCWVTDPAHPSTSKAPQIYAKGVSLDSVFARNFDNVFIMPKTPLQKGSRYSVHAALAIGSQTADISWSFTTAPAFVWNVSANPDEPWQDIKYALEHSSPGDTVQLAPGTYDIQDAVRLSGVRLVGAGAHQTRLRFALLKNSTPVVVDGRAVIEKLSLESPGQLIYQPSGSTLLLHDVALTGGNGQMVAVGLERGCSLVADRLDASAFNAYYVCYSIASGKGGEPRVYQHDVTRGRAGGGFVYGPSELAPLTQALPLP